MQLYLCNYGAGDDDQADVAGGAGGAGFDRAGEDEVAVLVGGLGGGGGGGADAGEDGRRRTRSVHFRMPVKWRASVVVMRRVLLIWDWR